MHLEFFLHLDEKSFDGCGYCSHTAYPHTTYPHIHQVALLTEDIEASFDKKLKVGAVFVNLSAAYDTIWHRGLTLKLLRIVPSKEMVRAIKGIILQRCFHVHIGKSK